MGFFHKKSKKKDTDTRPETRYVFEIDDSDSDDFAERMLEYLNIKDGTTLNQDQRSKAPYNKRSPMESAGSQEPRGPGEDPAADELFKGVNKAKHAVNKPKEELDHTPPPKAP